MTTRDLLHDFHALHDPGGRGARGTALTACEVPETAGHGRLAADVGALQVDHDEATGLPDRVVGLSASARLSTRSEGLAEQVVGRFIAERADLWGLSLQDASDIEIASVGSRFAHGSSGPRPGDPGRPDHRGGRRGQRSRHTALGAPESCDVDLTLEILRMNVAFVAQVLETP